jgi:hypothetical protein
MDCSYMTKLYFVFIVLALLLAFSTIAFSWGSTGHRIINLKAVQHLPDSMSTLKKDSLFFQSHASDADNRKISSDTSWWSEAERHYIDIDAYPNFKSLPHDMNTVISLYGRTTVHDNGTIPWATVMVLDSLTAQLRRGAVAKAESTMADLGHYVGDGHQPLHVTQNYDGQMTGNGGIHSRYETGMVGQFQSSIVITRDSARYISNPLEYVFSYLYVSNSYVDSIMAADVYAKATSGWSGSGSVPSAYYTALWAKVGTFTKQLFQQATVDLASLWYTAWVNSRTVQHTPATILAGITGGLATITPSGSVTVPYGYDTTFTWLPVTGYHLDSVLVDGVRTDSAASYTFTNVTVNHTITVYVSPNLYTISCTAVGNGTVAPGGTLTVSYGRDTVVSIIPQTGYHVDSVFCDNVRVDSLSRYTFHGVAANHTLSAFFSINHYQLTATAGLYGSVTPAGPLDVVYGASQRYLFTPDSGYHVDKVMVDGSSVDSLEGYTFSAVAANHSLGVTFRGPLTAVSVATVYSAGWNMISVPVIPDDSHLNVLVAGSISRAFAWQGNYAAKDSLVTGTGYWVKLGAESPVSFTGIPVVTDTIAVSAGWNLVGSLTSPLSVNSVASVPGGILVSHFFGYRGRYIQADTIQAGSAYWVRASQAGALILASSAPSSRQAFAAAGLSNEIPPSPPGAEVAAAEAGEPIPAASALRQVYPNPFNPSTTISYAVGSTEGSATMVTLRVYDVLGREVTRLVNESQQPGWHSVRFDASIAGGLPSGVYFVKLDIGGGNGQPGISEVRRILLSK